MKTRKIIVMLIVTLIFILMCTTISNATIDPDSFAPTVGENEAGDAIAIAQKIVGIINVVGTIILVVVIMALGLKYITGSLEQRAEYQKTMIPILVGAVLLFGVSWILKIIMQIIPTID